MQCANFPAESLAGIVILVHSPLSGHPYTFFPYFECYFLFSLEADAVHVLMLVQTDGSDIPHSLANIRTATFAAEMVRPAESAPKYVLFFSPSPDAAFTTT
jgi:hypothetical protein